MDLAKAMGRDSTSTYFIQHSSPEMHLLLLNIFNQSWISGQYSASWKALLVVPFYKVRDDPSQSTYIDQYTSHVLAN